MIYIIRHGQTEQNYRRLLTGRRDYRLNETGIRQAQEAGEWFRSRGIHFDLVYSSPLGRAVHTAKLAAPETELRIDDRLIEMEFGPYEGMDLTHPAPEVMTFFRDFEHNPAPAGMETLNQVTERLGGFLEWLKPEAAAMSAALICWRKCSLIKRAASSTCWSVVWISAIFSDRSEQRRLLSSSSSWSW